MSQSYGDNSGANHQIFTYNLFTVVVSPQVLESLRGGFVGNRQNPIPPFQLSEMSQGCGDASGVDHQLCSAGTLGACTGRS